MILSERLRLRPCREDDKDMFVAILNTERMMAHVGGVMDRAAIEALVDKRIADQARNGMSYWAVELRGENRLIGSCGVRIADDYRGTPVQGMYEAGWRIAEADWGKGYAYEAAQASFVWLWANTGAMRVAAWTIAANRPSWRLMERLGMRRREGLDFDRPARGAARGPERQRVYVLDRPSG
ncbi:GNAT family N-acetyltransferase [Allosphingosinicella deserti]|uniref:GNAT family N-acetyltransferase n=1 Tax=Allosphingosinicella deserti TaxID=2116704 RepID=A0A2P7QZ05_9SPHN|nr:GNAT family N-acetyltransferase [Sphingomonas deserti]PSJ43198.1 GNAT family N-acetyltransferase [Sphingomonas deserti]